MYSYYLRNCYFILLYVLCTIITATTNYYDIKYNQLLSKKCKQTKQPNINKIQVQTL